MSGYKIDNCLKIVRESDGAEVSLRGDAIQIFSDQMVQCENFQSICENYFTAKLVTPRKTSEELLNDFMSLIENTAEANGDATAAAVEFFNDLRTGRL